MKAYRLMFFEIFSYLDYRHTKEIGLHGAKEASKLSYLVSNYFPEIGKVSLFHTRRFIIPRERSDRGNNKIRVWKWTFPMKECNFFLCIQVKIPKGEFKLKNFLSFFVKKIFYSSYFSKIFVLVKKISAWLEKLSTHGKVCIRKIVHL